LRTSSQETKKMTQKRLFAAIPVPYFKEYEKSLDKLKALMIHDKINWIKPEQMHLTLHFFGLTETDKIPDINELLENAAKNNTVFDLQTSGISCFGSKHSPDIIRIIINENNSLIKLKASINKDLLVSGYITESVKFIPHITIGRIRKVMDVNYFWKVINLFNNDFNKCFKIENLHLYESILKTTGAVHNIIHTYKLQSPQ